MWHFIKKYKKYTVDIFLFLIFFVSITGLVIRNVQRYNVTQKLTTEVGSVIDFYQLAEQKALLGEKISGVAPLDYGVYFESDRRALMLCGDSDGDMDCQLTERLQEYPLKSEFVYSDFVPVNFLRFQKLDGVCLSGDCVSAGAEVFEPIGLVALASDLERSIAILVNKSTGEIK